MSTFPKQVAVLQAGERDAQILLGMARGFFASAWADLMENEHGRTFPQMEITEVMPESWDPAAWHAARTLYDDFDRANGGWNARAMWGLYCESAGMSKEDYGATLALRAMGHGVALTDHFHLDDSTFVYPHVEFSEASLERDYLADGQPDIPTRLDNSIDGPEALG